MSFQYYNLPDGVYHISAVFHISATETSDLVTVQYHRSRSRTLALRKHIAVTTDCSIQVTEDRHIDINVDA